MKLISPYLVSSDLISSELSALWLLADTANWVVRCEATRFVAAETDRGALGWKEVGCDEVRWDKIDETSDKNARLGRKNPPAGGLRRYRRAPGGGDAAVRPARRRCARCIIPDAARRRYSADRDGWVDDQRSPPPATSSRQVPPRTRVDDVKIRRRLLQTDRPFYTAIYY